MTESIENIIMLVLAGIGLAALVYLFKGFGKPGRIGSRTYKGSTERDIAREAQLLNREIYEQTKQREKMITSLEDLAMNDPEKVAGIIGSWISHENRSDPLRPTKKDLEQYLN